MQKLFHNVVALDSGARGATTSFVQRGQGDVLIAWENEALLSVKDAPDAYEVVVPSISILAEPSVAVVDEVVDRKGTRDVPAVYSRYWENWMDSWKKPLRYWELMPGPPLGG